MSNFLRIGKRKTISNKVCSEKRIILFLICPPQMIERILLYLFVSSLTVLFFFFNFISNGICLPGTTSGIEFLNSFYPITECLSFSKVWLLNFFVCPLAVKLFIKNFILKGDLLSVSIKLDLEDGIQNVPLYLSNNLVFDTVSSDHLSLFKDTDKINYWNFSKHWSVN